ncbi:hypothetical protein AMET1_0373 [Methanonatronarchaeum thermophilum]|uniref:Uncharacterized protein n=1 Tax=Methanonatronarchaeum thermophilum TaxID=1927129 RepID=A0A1Y3GEJ5_9EURY|nr:hypothetical protein [Methanonatronarchaeum thermophilum]OUJ18723.1 hypothetical protein AMET1_0373 [Methanonatronarchaeum thermophilum]
MKCKKCGKKLETDIKKKEIRCSCGYVEKIEGKDDRCLYKVW